MIKGVDLSKFKKVDANRDHTVFQSEDGHLIYVANKSINKDVHEALRNLPIQKMSQGGTVKRPGTDDEAKKIENAFNSATGWKKMSEGGKVGVHGSEATEKELYDYKNRKVNPSAPSLNEIPTTDQETLKKFLHASNFKKMATGVTTDATEKEKEQIAAQADTMLKYPMATAQDMEMVPKEAPSALSNTLEAAKRFISPSVNELAAAGQPVPAPQPELGAGIFERAAEGVKSLVAPSDNEVKLRQGMSQPPTMAAPATAGSQPALEPAIPATESAEQVEQRKVQEHVDLPLQLAEDYRLQQSTGEIDPNRLLASQGTWGRLMTGIGLAIGGAPTREFLQKQIDADIKAQQDAVGNRTTLYSKNLEALKDPMQARLMTNIMLNESVIARTQQEVNNASNPQAKNNAMNAAMPLIEQNQKMMQQLTQMRASTAGSLPNSAQGLSVPEISGHILTRVPEKLRKEAYEQLGNMQSNQSSLRTLKGLYADMSKIGGVEGSVPFSKAKTDAEAIRTAILTNAIKSLGANPSDRDLKTLEGLLPNATDRAEQVALKEKRMIDYVAEQQKKTSPTPILDAFSLKIKEPVTNKFTPRRK